jgi:hypothetical protein
MYSLSEKHYLQHEKVKQKYVIRTCAFSRVSTIPTFFSQINKHRRAHNGFFKTVLEATLSTSRAFCKFRYTETFFLQAIIKRIWLLPINIRSEARW